MRASQRAVFGLFQFFGPMTDPELAVVYDERRRFGWELPLQSPSGLRTRRKELTDAGHLRDSGGRKRLVSGRLAIVWEAA
jgi:hypothetical protein